MKGEFGYVSGRMLSQIEPSDSGIGMAVVTENRCNGFIKSLTC